MAISLSEQLESDIKAYLHKTFGTYFSSLDERFAADIKKDVISASDFHHEHYSDDDISIAFQRVTLGRMGHLDWQIYHLCTDTEVNTMKQNVKVNTPIHIRPASPEEAGLFYSELEEAADKKLGTVDHVRMDFGSSGKGFYHTWWPHNDDQFNTEEFKGELQEVVDALRADGPLKDLASMRSYCYRNGGELTEDGRCYGYAGAVLVCQADSRQLQKGCGRRAGNGAVGHHHRIPENGELPAGRRGKCPLPAPPGAGGVPAVSRPHQAH